ncbi:MAG: UDP-N-acetylmuramoyl-L-alanine--D-glutamate ligase [Clostridia bacterium]|nr:UDP-N-acetylmuramoyl-L-alanine--D-glutamate ligase [Clostridia bacterium]
MNGKKVMVLGMARSGVAAAKLLSELGAYVRLNDQKTKEKLGDAVKPLEACRNIEWRLGEPAEELLDGQDMLLISPGVPIDSPVVKKAEELGVEVIGELELGFRTAKGLLVAITGTNGKTTTTTLVGEIFKNFGKQTYVVGNIGFPYTAVSGGMKEEDVTVCEVSSFQMESVKEFRPKVAAMLNITEDHLNRHYTMENYAATKARIFANQTGDDEAVVLNYDDAAVQAMAKDVKCRVIWFSRKATPPFGAFVVNGNIVYGTAEEHVQICAASDVYIPGPHNLENALAAAAMTMAAGVPVSCIGDTLRTFKGVEHRIEFVRELDGVRFINDSKGTNADSTIKAVETMNKPTVMILGGSDKHVDFTAMCRIIKNSPYIRHVVLIGQTAAQLDETLKKVGYTNYEHAGYDFEAAIQKAFSLAEEGGNVLLSPACASFDMFKDYEQRGEIFKNIVHGLKSRASD